MSQKIWKVRGVKEKFSDEELIELISQGELLPEDYVCTSDMKTWVQIKKSIYQYYIGGKANETL